jgi:hypothetical protein
VRARTVRRGDGDAARPLLRRLVDLIIRHVLRKAFVRQHARDRGSQRRLAVVHVADGADVQVLLRAAVDIVRREAAR